MQTIHHKDNANWFGYFGPAWPKSKIVSTYRKLWSLSACEKISFISYFFSWDIAKMLHTFYFEYLRHVLLFPFNMEVPTSRKSLCRSVIKSQLHSSFFLIHWKDFANILIIWRLWTWLAMATKIDRITLKKNLIFIYLQKINFTPSFFEILQIQYKLVVLGTFSMTGYGHQKKRY